MTKELRASFKRIGKWILRLAGQAAVEVGPGGGAAGDRETLELAGTKG